MTNYASHFLRTKIWVTFFIILAVSAAAVIWSYFSYQKLIGSIELLSEPDEKIELIQNTIQRLTKADNYIQSFILSNHVGMYRAYHHEIEAIRTNLDSLKSKMTEDSLQIQKVDSLEILLSQKLRYLDDFLKIKRKRQAKNYSNEALEMIANNTTDSTEIQSEVRTTLRTTEEVMPKFEKIVIDREYREPGLWGGVKRFFGDKEVRPDTIMQLKNDTIRGIEVSVDTLMLTNYNPDTNLIKVKEILEEVAHREFENQFLLSSKELGLLRQDQRLFEEIDKIINHIKQYEQNVALKRRSDSYLVARNSTKVILVIGTTGILLGGVLLLIIGRDFTHSQYLSRRLEIERNRANEHARVKEEFLANMSHEIRTPLNSILGYSHLLDNTYLDRDQQLYSQAISGNTKYLFSLVNDILDFSKLNFSKTELEKRPFLLRETINQIISLFRIQFEKKGLKLISSCDPALDGIELIGDEFRIKQVITNLLSNSLKFTEKGYVELKVSGRRRIDRYSIQIDVTDTGKGIEPHKFKTIFNSFEQEDITVTKKYGGTGLGLSIVKKLVEAMNGKITVDSKINERTTFSVRLMLPFQTPKTLPVTNGKNIHDASHLNAHIVLIEDDHWNMILLRKMLESKTKKLSSFEKPDEALEFIRKEFSTIDLVLTDISMPQISGIDILNVIKSLDISIPVIAVTAHALKSKVLRLRELGFSDVLTKPFDEISICNVLFKRLPGDAKPDFRNDSEKVADRVIKLDIGKIKNFAGDDPKLLEELVTELKISNEANIKRFEETLIREDHQALFEIAHKMAPTYDSLNQISIVESLKELELFYRMNKRELMIKRAEKLLPHLHEINELLNGINFQSYI
jgi:signal transduction histidine kinase/FixJ family two-component response regulator/CHASE3 domain sensor protein